jgi:UTP-glucose-1-phosphate uridylyltransferase
MKPTLLILAAGMGSRYGGIKQLDGFGPNGETIIDYSLFDAIKAGFGKVVFIIRKELKEDFTQIFGPKLEGKIEFDFAIQSVENYLPSNLAGVKREKPWGTGHAVLCAKDYTSTPFAVINADDFYGFDAYKTMADFLANNENEQIHSMIGYQIKNTLSENGTVSRGVCETNADGYLENVVERTKILKNNNGEIVFLDNGEPVVLGENTLVSMNFWGFMPNVFNEIEKMFHDYANENVDSPKSEFYIPKVMSHLIENNLGKCKVFESTADWFGVTYPEDKPDVTNAIQKLINLGKYPSELW